jgi:hypothetical protein
MPSTPSCICLAACAVVLICVQVSSGCAGGHQDSAREPVGIGGRTPKYGDYGKQEVEALRAAIAQVAYPAKDGTVARLLPRPVEPMPIEFLDWMADEEKKGRIGGNIVEYWLNRDYVLKVATAYYTEGDDHPSREEWAVILTRKEWQTFERPIYPTVVKFHVPKN